MKRTELSIRMAESRDAEPLARFAAYAFHAAFADENDPADMNAYISTAFTPEQTAREISDPDSTFFLAFEDDAFAGFVKLHAGNIPDCVTGPVPIELERIYADPERIGSGIGKRLMQAALEYAQQSGFRTVWLGVWERNIRAIRFYRSRGFADVGSHAFVLGSDVQTDRVFQLPLDRPAS